MNYMALGYMLRGKAHGQLGLCQSESSSNVEVTEIRDRTDRRADLSAVALKRSTLIWMVSGIPTCHLIWMGRR